MSDIDNRHQRDRAGPSTRSMVHDTNQGKNMIDAAYHTLNNLRDQVEALTKTVADLRHALGVACLALDEAADKLFSANDSDGHTQASRIATDLLDKNGIAWTTAPGTAALVLVKEGA